VANLFLPLWADAELAAAHVAEAQRHPGVVLGAYCGKADGERVAAEASFAALFAAAREADLPVDLHIDETDDVSAGGNLLHCARALRTARAAGYRQPVVCGHCCSASLLPAAALAEVTAAVAAAEGVTIVCNPHTNTSLQGRRGQADSVRRRARPSRLAPPIPICIYR
jgi:cytosine deaminase